GPVRGGVGRGAGHGRVQRVDLDESGAETASGPGGQLVEVAEVAHAPGAAGQQRVELDEQAVGTSCGGRQPGRGDDQVGPRGAPVGGGGGHLVNAGREPVGTGAQLALLGADAQPGALRERGQRGRDGAAPAGDGGRQQPAGQLLLAGGERGAHRLGGGRVHAECGEGEGDGGGRGVDGAVRGGTVGGGDAMQLGEPGEV